MKTALITGITGQDGSYLAELLLEKGYEVHGVKRRSSSFNTQRVDHMFQDPHVENNHFFLHYGDLTDSSNLTRIIQQVQPDEIYNLAAQSHVAVSFESPEYTADVDALGTVRLLEAIRLLGLEKKTRFYQASTSELYGLVQETPQKETTPFYPRSPYAVAKLYAYWITVNYRESYGIYACNGILFNHESARRGETFVTRKITRGLANIAQGLEKCLYMAISTHSVTGVTPRIMSECSGSCCNSSRLKILLSLQGCNILFVISSAGRLRSWALCWHLKAAGLKSGLLSSTFRETRLLLLLLGIRL